MSDTLHSFLPSRDAPDLVLMERIQLAMDGTPHNHPGRAGVSEGTGCLRCNAERALNTLVGRARRNV